MTTVEKRNAGETQIVNAIDGATPYGPTSNRYIFLNWLKQSTDLAARAWWLQATTPRVSSLAATGTSFSAAICLPNGRVVFAPQTGSIMGLFDPLTNTYTNGVAVTGVSRWGGVLMRDGRVACIPRTYNKITLYNPTDNTFTESVADFGTLADKYLGGVCLHDGRVVLARYTNGTTITVWDPITDTIAEYGNIPGNNRFIGAVLIPDGRVVFVPHSVSGIWIYNPADNSVTNPFTIPGTLSNRFRGGVLLPNGKVLFVPHNSTVIGIYDPIANTYETYGDIVGSTKYEGGILMADGRVIFAPSNAAIEIGVFDYRTNTFTTIPGSAGGVYKSGCLLPDGRAVLCPSSTSTPIRIISGFSVPPLEQCVHPSFNKF